MLVVRFDTDQPAGRPVREQRVGAHGVPRSAAKALAPRRGRTREHLRPSKGTCSLRAEVSASGAPEARPGDCQPHGWPNQPPMEASTVPETSPQALATARHVPAAAVLTVARWSKATEKKYPSSAVLNENPQHTVLPHSISRGQVVLVHAPGPRAFQRGVLRPRQQAPDNATVCECLW